LISILHNIKIGIFKRNEHKIIALDERNDNGKNEYTIDIIAKPAVNPMMIFFQVQLL